MIDCIIEIFISCSDLNIVIKKCKICITTIIKNKKIVFCKLLKQNFIGKLNPFFLIKSLTKIDGIT